MSGKDWAENPGRGFLPPSLKKSGTFAPYYANFTAEAVPSDVTPEFSPALLREMIQEEEEHIRGLDYMVTRHRTRLAWLRAVQRGTTKP